MCKKKIITIRNKLHKFTKLCNCFMRINPFYATFAAETD